MISTDFARQLVWGCRRRSAPNGGGNSASSNVNYAPFPDGTLALLQRVEVDVILRQRLRLERVQLAGMGGSRAAAFR